LGEKFLAWTVEFRRMVWLWLIRKLADLLVTAEIAIQSTAA